MQTIDLAPFLFLKNIYNVGMHYIVGLGNPGEEYKISRHNTGWIMVDGFRKFEKFGEFEKDKKLNALVSEGKIKKEKIMLILPETFMNKSGNSIKSLVKSKKAAESLIVIHDDLDIPLGKIKISFGKNSGGHRGVESIMRVIKTKDFIRIRVGISPATPKGKIKKPEGEKVIDHILQNFKPKELEILKKNSKKIVSALETIIIEGLEKAMSLYNG
ncbi:aminoacyl-tRNA hydrolase [Patescibacteria group bacterium]|nr:aminoacyl-tRNA hydrolase [Patescibacteria group bacterium]